MVDMICILDAPILVVWQQVFEALHHPEFVRIDSRLEDIACRRRSMHIISPILLSSSMIEALYRYPRVSPKQLKLRCVLYLGIHCSCWFCVISRERHAIRLTKISRKSISTRAHRYKYSEYSIWFMLNYYIGTFSHLILP